jgi:hypothetical protein
MCSCFSEIFLSLSSLSLEFFPGENFTALVIETGTPVL